MAKIFTFPCSFRIDKKTNDAINEILEIRQEKYFSKSHIVRCAVICILREIREEEENENRKFKHKSKRF